MAMIGGALYVIIGVLVISVVMWVLLPTFITFIQGASLDNISVDGSNSVDYSWAGTLFIVMYILACALLPIGVLVYVVSKFTGKGGE